MASHDSLADIWQYLLAGATATSAFVASHIKVRDRVKTLEVKSGFMEQRAELLDDTHTTVVRLEERIASLESDVREGGEALSSDMKDQRIAQDRVMATLEKIERAFDIDSIRGGQ